MPYPSDPARVPDPRASHGHGQHGPCGRRGPDPLGGPARAAVGGQATVVVRGPMGTARPAGTGQVLRDVRLPLAVGLCVLAATAYLALTDPYRPGPHLVCPVLALTGFACAGCGGQRAVHDLARLDVVAAWDMNPLVVLAAPLAAVAWGRWLRRRWRHVGAGPASRSRLASSTAVPWVLAAVVVVFAVLRNVPALAPWLAP